MGKNLTIILIGLLLVGCGGDYKFKKAQKLEEQGRNKEAINQYLNLIQKSPRSPRKVDALFNVAEIYFRLGDFKSSFSHYQELIKASPNHPKIAYIQFRCGESSFLDKEFEDAKSYFQDIVDKHPDTEYAERSRQKLNEIEKIKNEVAELLKEAILAYRDNEFKTAIEKYEAAKTLNPYADVESKISQTKEKQSFVERVNEFNRILRQAKKFDWKMPANNFFAVTGKLKKATYGENEFERKRDEKRAERDYQEMLQTIYYAPLEIPVSEYDFSSGTLGFKNLEQYQGMDFSLGDGVVFNKDIKFKDLKLEEKEAELTKQSTKSSYFHEQSGMTFTKYVVKGILLFKIIKTHEEVIPHSGAYTLLDAEVIDARIKVPRHGYLYMSK